ADRSPGPVPRSCCARSRSTSCRASSVRRRRSLIHRAYNPRTAPPASPPVFNASALDTLGSANSHAVTSSNALADPSRLATSTHRCRTPATNATTTAATPTTAPDATNHTIPTRQRFCPRPWNLSDSRILRYGPSGWRPPRVRSRAGPLSDRITVGLAAAQVQAGVGAGLPRTPRPQSPRRGNDEDPVSCGVWSGCWKDDAVDDVFDV